MLLLSEASWTCLVRNNYLFLHDNYDRVASDFTPCSSPAENISSLPFQILFSSSSVLWLACMDCLHMSPCSGFSWVHQWREATGDCREWRIRWCLGVNASGSLPINLLSVSCTSQWMYRFSERGHSFYEELSLPRNGSHVLRLLGLDDKVATLILNPGCCTIAFLYMLLKWSCWDPLWWTCYYALLSCCFYKPHYCTY